MIIDMSASMCWRFHIRIIIKTSLNNYKVFISMNADADFFLSEPDNSILCCIIRGIEVMSSLCHRKSQFVCFHNRETMDGTEHKFWNIRQILPYEWFKVSSSKLTNPLSVFKIQGTALRPII